MRASTRAFGPLFKRELRIILLILGFIFPLLFPVFLCSYVSLWFFEVSSVSLMLGCDDNPVFAFRPFR
uniref:Uncharacterized protein n=1 Tax=Meloidogyne enterolobii TaxID=390850 RepID=A0A6V7V6I0_MELEN|nr:unnamed protein product [Meloidogyne enterolobii]